MDNFVLIIFSLAVLIFSVMIHEIAHGAMALRLGDDTAKKAGRLTLNPLKHVDPIGSIFLPLILALTQSPILIGWAKPVPYDPSKLKDPRKGSALIALAGPMSNLIVAAIFGLILRVMVGSGLMNLVPAIVLTQQVVILNIVLAVFNLVPIPPLDGASVLFAFLPRQAAQIENLLRRYGFMFLILFILFGIQLIAPVILGLFRLLAGTPFLY